MNKTKTVAIIGGGVAGLAVGGLLARQGVKVRLFEANQKLGGSCANTVLNGYTFHDGALYLVFPGLLDVVFEKVGLDRAALLPLHKIKANQSTWLPDGSVVTFGEDQEVSVSGARGEERTVVLRREIDRMMQKWQPVCKLFAEDILLHPLSFGRLLAKGWRHLPKFGGMVAGELERLFSDPAVRAAMAGVLLYSGAPPQQSPVTSILALVAMLADGFYLPEGGMGKISEALSQALTRHGAEVCLDAPVNRIVLKNGRVVGVDVRGQGLVEADAVVSTVTAMSTYTELLDWHEVPGSMQRRVQRARLSHKALCVQLGLANRIEACSHSNAVLPMLEDMHQVFRPGADGLQWPIYSVPTVTAPELAPAGGSIIEMYPPIEQGLAAEDWDDQRKDRAVEAAIEALARIYPLDIVVTRAFSPKDYQDRLHLYRGSIYGLSPNAPITTQFPHATPIRGLYQAGQTTYPGYGVSSAAVSGIFAAEAAAAGLRE